MGIVFGKKNNVALQQNVAEKKEEEETKNEPKETKAESPTR